MLDYIYGIIFLISYQYATKGTRRSGGRKLVNIGWEWLRGLTSPRGLQSKRPSIWIVGTQVEYGQNDAPMIDENPVSSIIKKSSIIETVWTLFSFFKLLLLYTTPTAPSATTTIICWLLLGVTNR